MAGGRGPLVSAEGAGEHGPGHRSDCGFSDMTKVSPKGHRRFSGAALAGISPEMRSRALVVEDEGGTRDLLRQVLEDEGFQVDIAVDGEKAIGFLANNSYEIVLLDMVLPRVSGADVMEHLLCTKPQVLEKIIVVTGVPLD